MYEEIDINILPGVLREMVDLIGLPATMQIVQRHGGTRLWVPALIETLAPDHKLVKLVGMTSARTLSEQYGGETLEIPKAERALRAIRDKAIREQWPHKSQSQLAIEYNLTERQVRTILSSIEQQKWPTLKFE
jgi:Mor transcription activator family